VIVRGSGSRRGPLLLLNFRAQALYFGSQGFQLVPYFLVAYLFRRTGAGVRGKPGSVWVGLSAKPGWQK